MVEYALDSETSCQKQNPRQKRRRVHSAPFPALDIVSKKFSQIEEVSPDDDDSEDAEEGQKHAESAGQMPEKVIAPRVFMEDFHPVPLTGLHVIATFQANHLAVFQIIGTEGATNLLIELIDPIRHRLVEHAYPFINNLRGNRSCFGWGRLRHHQRVTAATAFNAFAGEHFRHLHYFVTCPACYFEFASHGVSAL